MNPLNGFYEKAMNTVPTQLSTDINFDYFDNEAFKKMVNEKRVDFSNEHNLAIIIKNNIDEIVNDILSGYIPYRGYFENDIFIAAFIRAINSIPNNYNIVLACNKLAYDYFTSENPLPEIKKMYLNLSRSVNRQVINSLITLGLDENTASNLAFCRYSSKKERTNVKRLNFVLYNKDPNVMTEQMIIWIYEKMFDHISDLFYGIMFEVYPPEQEQEFGENFMEIYGSTGNAVLTILNNMSSDNIRKVLTVYSNDWMMSGRPPVRFSLRSLSADFSRISNTVEFLNETGTPIP